ncbi:MAG: diphthine synthase [Candidatus Nanohaloarchaea archaeon]|jgi:diphthine synthase
MLHLIGLGLDNDEITVKGLNAIENSEKVFAEFYTNTETVDLQKIEEKKGKEIEKLTREQVEQEDKIVESAKEQETAFLVSGDALTATTHFDIKRRAEKQGLETNVVHAPSIFTGIAETGLSIYKFGRTVTLPKNMKPGSITDYIEKNDSIGLHTLVLLDIDYSADEAAEKLIEMDSDLEKAEAVFFERSNLDSQSVQVGELGELSASGEPPHSIIIIGETSHVEEENLEDFR